MLDAAFGDRAVFLRASGALVVADVHVGRDEASTVEFPLGERRDLTGRLADLLDRFEPREVVFAGDVLHRFGRVSARTDETLSALVEACRERGARPTLVAGNHDTMLGEVWDGPIHDAYRVDERTLVCHGHECPGAEAPLYVLGHDHPSIRIEGRRRPCFLYGEAIHEGSDVLVLPAFNRLAGGATVNGMRASEFRSPLVTDADALRPIVYDGARDEALSFPPLGAFRRML